MGGKQTKYSNCKHSDSLSYGSPYCPLPQHLSPGNSMNSNGTKFLSRYRRIDDNYSSLDQVKEALAQSGLESSNLIIGIDFTKSNEWMGKHSSNEKSLHHIGEGLNPYQHAISIIGSTLSAFDEDNLIPCFGFGDVTTHDQDVFSFYPDNKPCNGFEEVLSRYREIVPNVRLAGPTSYAPIIETAIGVVDKSGGQYHVLLIIVDGQVTRSVDTSVGQLSPQERSTVEAIVKASNYPLSIVLVGVGDGPWHMMQKFDDNIPARAFDNIQFVNFTEIMVRNVPLAQKEAEFALAALMEIPLQYRATLELQLLSNRRGIPGKAPLPPPSGNFRSSNPPANYFPSSSFAQYYTAFCPPSPTPTGNFSSNRNCPICYWHKRDLAFGCGHQTCNDCGRDLPLCPICRMRISTRIRLYE
ncbi:E3 ubiquitin- ligase RGLG2 [Olea europaea subsp. europaea]|uniref:E3 ubiquitin- ligase RGLG2 n=1 Tax=Olea europaea subsp. europaea TaxID=158383 RepID=A0A8S0THT2_OLEEU|nr:E3 ubiquitin- ligase RGLG2 [Olea europaea subsp. europaea]